MRKIVTALVCVALADAALGQEDGTEAPPPASALEEAIEAAAAPEREGEITVTATRTSRDPFELPFAISTFARDTVEKEGSFVAMKAISRRAAYIWYDERTGTTTDPIIRGFAGFNLLTLVDGNTLSTLWGEGGFGADDMYGKLDPEVVQRIEVIRGPHSALYGSNALGAVINVITRDSPIDYTEEGFRWGRRVKLGYQSVNEGAFARGEVYGADPRFKFLLGGSAREYDHVDGGGDLDELVPSDGRERNWDLSTSFLVTPGRELRLTVQDVHRDHVKRYYRPFQDNENDREAVALFFRDDVPNDLVDSLEARLYWQHKRDGRRFFHDPTYTTLDKGEAITDTWQAGLQGTRDLGCGHVLTVGLAFELDEGDSPDDEQFTYYFPPPKRRDAPLSDWRDYGVYAQDEWRIDDAWSLVGTARYDRLVFETDVDEHYRPPLGDPQADEFRDSVGALTGGLGAVYRWSDELHLVANWSRGFRQNAPNFGLRQLGDGILVPNQLLDPTTADNFEVGVKGRYPGARFEGFVYKTLIDNWQGDLRSTTYDGRSFLDFNGNGTRDANEGFVTQVEGGDAYVYGVELGAELHPHTLLSRDIPPHFSVWGSFARNVGRVDDTDTHPYEEPLRHTQPTRGLLGVRWDDVDHPSRELYVELVADMVNRYHDIPLDRKEADLAWREDPQDGGSGYVRDYVGVPGYTLFHLYAGMRLTENVMLRVGVENLTDKEYRVAHSRMDAPGINFLATLEIEF